jgi:hypothetical protein
LVALADIMRLSLKKGAHSALSSAAWQEIRVRSGRDDKGEGGASMESGLEQKAFFITLGCSGQDDNSRCGVVWFFQGGSAELQIPPLRSESVTLLIFALFGST